MEEPKISVIIPVYNAELYLEKCLDSVLQQTYRNLDIILVDDGSTDRSGEICDTYVKKDARFRVIHQCNAGVASARNTGLSVAGGEWIGWLDADDWIDLDFYETLLGLAIQYHTDISQCGIILEDGAVQDVQFAPAKTVCYAKGMQVYPENGQIFYSNGIWNKLYRTRILKGAQFHNGFLIGEDLLFNLDVLEHANAVVLDKQAKYHYVQHDGSACHAVPNKKHLLSYREALVLAIIKYAAYPGVQKYLWTEYLRNDLDICSKVVCFHLGWAKALIGEIRKELRQEIVGILHEPLFSKKEKLKFMTILFAWPVYDLILPRWKQFFSGRQKV